MKPELPADRVSRNRKVVSQCKPVGMAIVKFESGAVTISCGWVKIHSRTKVLEDAAQNHLNKKHGGTALWM